MRLASKHAVVTGAGQGIGEALSRAIAREGASVTCLDKNAAGAGNTAAIIRAAGGKAIAVTADTTRLAEIEAALEKAVDAFGAVNVLVANAGGSAGKRCAFLDLTTELWNDMLERNLTGAFHTGLAFGRHMAANGGGSIVFTSSIIAEFAGANMVHYGASKGGVKMLMRGMALELAPHKVRVNAIAPGAIVTPANVNLITVPDVKAKMEAETPLGTLGHPDQLAGAVIYLASDESSYTTGTTITVDGGRTLT
jgi:NAD(P)-dependent dehydrogenase (short-subunit alcohol dehydrogenase family)